MEPSREIHPYTVRSDAIVTTSYVAGNIVGDMSEYNSIGLEVDITLGSLTSVELKIEESQDGTNYYQQVAESGSGGTISDALALRQFTADGTYAILIHPVRTAFVKISVKGTGTVTGSSVGIKAYTTWS